MLIPEPSNKKNPATLAMAILVLFVLVLAPLQDVVANRLPGLNGVEHEPSVGKPGKSNPVVNEAPGDWWAKVEENLRKKEYQVTWQAKTNLQDLPAAYQASNRAHQLRTYFTQQGIRILSRKNGDKGQDSWHLQLYLEKFGTATGMTAVKKTTAVKVEDNRVEYHYPSGLTEWYVNSEAGVEQGFTVFEAPGGQQEAELVFELSIQTNLMIKLAEDQSKIRLVTNGEADQEMFKEVWSYGHLAAFDANGKPLDVRMVLPDCTAKRCSGKKSLQIVVNVLQAVYPIMVDPLITLESAQSSEGFGLVVSGAGDVNGDNYADVLVGAPDYYYGDSGSVFLYYGAGMGLSTTPNWSVSGIQSGEEFGSAVGAAGDVNGDSYADIVIGGPQFTSGQEAEGRVVVFYGSANGLSATPDWITEGQQAGINFGSLVRAAGDINGDGYGDVLVGANHYQNGENQEGEGRVMVYLGSAGGLAATPAWTYESDQKHALLGTTGSPAGDVNGDGFDDLILGMGNYDGTPEQIDTGRVDVFHGSINGLSASPDWTVTGGQDYGYLGYSVSSAGDVNSDGYADVIVGMPGSSSNVSDEGAALVYYGSSSGLSMSASWAIAGSQVLDQAEAMSIGSSVSNAGDFNGDGFGDVIVGTPYPGYDQEQEGSLFAFYGSATGLEASAAWRVDGNSAYGWFTATLSAVEDVNGDGFSDIIVGSLGKAMVYLGSVNPPNLEQPNWAVEGSERIEGPRTSVSSAGDVNNDGYIDVIVGADKFDNGQGQGAVFVFYGSVAGLSTEPDWSIESEDVFYPIGSSVSSAGDVNGDGYDDVIVGSPLAGNDTWQEGIVSVYYGSSSGLGATAAWTVEGDSYREFLGTTVVGVGDVNHDGYDDVAVGAAYHSVDQQQGEVENGQVRIYFGSSGGLAATAGWINSGDQAFAHYGIALDGAGDINDDGYADVVVGVCGRDNGETNEGMAYLYLGSAQGLSASASWSGEGNQVEAWYGCAVGGVGDVNGDGYADVAIGAPLYDGAETDEGAAYVYYGSASGLAATPAWMTEGEQAGAMHGLAVGRAGDVNGDGYDDVLISAPLYTNPNLEEGRVSIYYGGTVGLSAAPDRVFEGERDQAYFGYALSLAGDINGDGFDDILIRAADPYRVNLFFGYADGAQYPTLKWTAESNQQYAYFGWSMSVAGDINGDTFIDLIIGAPHYTNGQTDEGAFFLYYGTSNGLGATPVIIEGNMAGALLGWSVSTAGDVNGDGYDDVIVSATGCSSPEANEGCVYVYLGGEGGLSATPVWSAQADQTYAAFGYVVGTAGDINGDGKDDVFVGAPNYSAGQEEEGKVFIYYGTTEGVSQSANWTAEGNQNYANFGLAVAPAGDVNGDGNIDLIVGAPNASDTLTGEGKAYVFFSTTGGLEVTPGWIGQGGQEQAHFGESVSGAGEINGDGKNEVMVGAPGYDGTLTDEGQVFLFFSSVSGLNPTPDWIGSGEQENSSFGASIGLAGDVDGNGYDDLLFGASRFSNGETSEGKAFLYYVTEGGIVESPGWTVEGNQAFAGYGYFIGSAGSIAGNGIVGYFISANQIDRGETDEGRVYLYTIP